MNWGQWVTVSMGKMSNELGAISYSFHGKKVTLSNELGAMSHSFHGEEGNWVMNWGRWVTVSMGKKVTLSYELGAMSYSFHGEEGNFE